MIRINLLKKHETVPERNRAALRFPVKLKTLAAVLSVLILVSAAVFAYIKWNPLAKKSAGFTLADYQASQIPQKPEYQPKIVLSHAVEEIVKEIQGDHRILPRYSTYRSLAPAAKIEHQLSICKKALGYFKNATSADIGFTDLIITTPGDLYLHGMASSKERYDQFRRTMSETSFLKIKPGISKAIGESNMAREFSFYGTFKFRPPTSSGKRVVSVSELPDLVRQMKNTAAGSGIQLGTFTFKSKSNLGLYKRHIYMAQAENITYKQFQNFVTKLHVAKSKVGILKFALKAENDEILTASMELVMYTN